MDESIILIQFGREFQLRLSPRTIHQYQKSVDHFLTYTEKSVQAVNKQDVRQWILYLSNQRYSPNTIRSQLNALKKFFRFCYEDRICKINPTEGIKSPNKFNELPKYLTEEQIAQVREFLLGHRLIERAVFELLYATGVRISELCAIKKEDIDWENRVIQILRGKGNKDRIVLFTRQCESHLKAYLDSRTDENPFLFASSKLSGRPIHISSVDLWFKGYSKALGYRFTPHTLRHTFGVMLTRRGMPLEYIQVILGHEGTEQTRFYIRLYNQAQKERYDSFM